MITTTLSIKELRAKLKPLGFTVKTQMLSFGRAGKIVRIKDNKEMPSMFTGEADLAQWKPAIDAITGIELVEGGYRVSGPWSGLK